MGAKENLMSIVIEKLRKKYGEKKVFEDFSYCFPKQKITAIMGPSGCGKTTLMRILLGLEAMDSGKIAGMGEAVAVVFQEDRLCEEATVLDNLRLVQKGKDSQSEILDCLKGLGMQDEANVRVSSLSGGMKRRVAIARAILAVNEYRRKSKGQSGIVFLDEPFKGLDDETKYSVMQYVKDSLLDQTVLFVTHDEKEAKYMASQICKL